MLYDINQKQWAQIIRSHVEYPGELVPLCMGPNGIGKSQIVYQVARELHIQVLDVRLMTLFPTDLRGMPWVDREKNQVVWGRPSYLPNDGRGILFLDELTNCSPEMQAAAYEIIQNRRCGEHKLGDGWTIIAAGNRIQDHTGARALLTGLATRLVQLNMEPDPKLWLSWAIQNNVDKRVIGYIATYPDLLLHDNPNEAAHCRPRTWAYVGQTILPHYPKETWEPMIAGSVGEGQASNFMSWISGLKLPGPADVLFKGAKMPESSSAGFTVASSIARMIITAKPQDRPTLLSAFLRVSTSWQPDKGYMVTQAIKDSSPDALKEMTTRPEFPSWVRVYKEVLL